MSHIYGAFVTIQGAERIVTNGPYIYGAFVTIQADDPKSG